MRSLFERPKVIIGMVHLKPMPGFPGSSGDMSAIIKHAVEDALTLQRGGVDGLIVENIFNRPRQKTVGPETVVPMTLAMKEIVETVLPGPLTAIEVGSDLTVLKSEKATVVLKTYYIQSMTGHDDKIDDMERVLLAKMDSIGKCVHGILDKVRKMNRGGTDG